MSACVTTTSVIALSILHMVISKGFMQSSWSLVTENAVQNENNTAAGGTGNHQGLAAVPEVQVMSMLKFIVLMFLKNYKGSCHRRNSNITNINYRSFWFDIKFKFKII